MKSSLRDNFCSSPWFHIRINPSGDFLPCRWNLSDQNPKYNIQNTSIIEYMNSDDMRNLRMSLLAGQENPICNSCRNEGKYGKVNGRVKQLLKSGISLNNFEKTLCASPHFEWFDYSNKNEGYTDKYPVDLQIDLGNTCNSGCIMCVPIYSSRLAKDYEILEQQDPVLFKFERPKTNWADDPKLVNKLIDELSCIQNIRYIHFLGGETLYLKSFYDICEKLIEKGLAKNISLGTTTNCTVYSKKLENIIKEFKNFHLGLSIESFHIINDYVRWPSEISVVNSNIQKFLDLRNTTNLHLSLRITPSNLTILHIDTIFEFMLKNSIISESCNLLMEPSCMRIEILPEEILAQTSNKINQIIEKYSIKNSDKIINLRNENVKAQVIQNTIFEYSKIISSARLDPNTVERERYNLVKFLKSFESLRNNNILEYLPEYEEFLRRYGY